MFKPSLPKLSVPPFLQKTAIAKKPSPVAKSAEPTFQVGAAPAGVPLPATQSPVKVLRLDVEG